MKAVKSKLDEIQRKIRGQQAIVSELAWGVQELQTISENNSRGGLSRKLGEGTVKTNANSFRVIVSKLFII